MIGGTFFGQSKEGPMLYVCTRRTFLNWTWVLLLGRVRQNPPMEQEQCEFRFATIAPCPCMPLSPSSCSPFSTPIRLILRFSAGEVMYNPKSQGMTAGSGDAAQPLTPGSYYQGQHSQLPQYSTWTASSSLIPRYPITSSFTLFTPHPSLLPTS